MFLKSETNRKTKKLSPTFFKILLSVHIAGLLPSSDGCGCNNGPTDGFIRGRLRQPAGGSFRGNRELKRQELRVKRRLRASDAASPFGCRIPPESLQDRTVAGLACVLSYTRLLTQRIPALHLYILIHMLGA